MDTTDITRYQDIFVAAVTTVGLKVLGALVFWVVGRWLIGLVLGMIRKALERQKVDPTVLRYLSSVVSVTLNVFLVIGILGYFGVQTTTFAALVAGIGIAIGAAWAGLLANFAAGAFMITLRPFKVGDFVTVAGVTGTVTEIGLFATTLNTPDNVSTVIGNNKIFGDNIQNFVTNPFRRVELKCQLSGAADHRAAIALLREKIAALPNVLATPPRSKSTSSNSTWSAQCWRCAPTATTTTTGRCISTPTRCCVKHWPKRASRPRCPRRTWW